MRKPKEILSQLERKSDSHKGENGKLLIVGGSREYTGAPAIAARAALRSGCDLVTIATSSKVQDVVASYSENFIVRSYGEEFREGSVEKIRHLMEWSDAAVIGPGLGEKDPAEIEEFAKEYDKPIVSDATAINPIARTGVSKVIFTPHKQELERLERFTGLDQVVDNGIIVLEKSKTDVVHSDKGTFQNTTGCSAMTVGGTGDALAGIAGSFMAQGVELDEAAYLAAYINGRAGELAEREFGYGLVATDLVEKIPEAVSSEL